MNGLRKCPFCGERARIDIYSRERMYYVRVVCDGCDIQTKTYITLKRPEPENHKTGICAFLIRKWNLRAENYT